MMKNLLIFSLIIGLVLIFGCGEPADVQERISKRESSSSTIIPRIDNNLAPAAPVAPPFHHPSRGLTEEILVPVQRIAPKVGSAQSILRDGSPPELYIAAFKLESGARGAVQIQLFVGREKKQIGIC